MDNNDLSTPAVRQRSASPPAGARTPPQRASLDHLVRLLQEHMRAADRTRCKSGCLRTVEPCGRRAEAVRRLHARVALRHHAAAPHVDLARRGKLSSDEACAVSLAREIAARVVQHFDCTNQYDAVRRAALAYRRRGADGGWTASRLVRRIVAQACNAFKGGGRFANLYDLGHAARVEARDAPVCRGRRRSCGPGRAGAGVATTHSVRRAA